MANSIDPTEKPREFLATVLAAALLVFNDQVHGSSEAFKVAEEFITEAEKRYGKIKP
jgi:hypothetical protein